MKEADAVARGIAQVRLAPQPWLIPRLAIELNAGRRELTDPRVQILELEIHDDTMGARHASAPVQRERRVADGALEPRIVRRIADDQPQAEASIESDRGQKVRARHGDLVEVHAECRFSRRLRANSRSTDQAPAPPPITIASKPAIYNRLTSNPGGPNCGPACVNPTVFTELKPYCR